MVNYAVYLDGKRESPVIGGGGADDCLQFFQIRVASDVRLLSQGGSAGAPKFDNLEYSVFNVSVLSVNRNRTRPRVLLVCGPDGKCHRTAEIKNSTSKRIKGITR